MKAAIPEEISKEKGQFCYDEGGQTLEWGCPESFSQSFHPWRYQNPAGQSPEQSS